jgi:hypothetical protein
MEIKTFANIPTDITIGTGCHTKIVIEGEGAAIVLSASIKVFTDTPFGNCFRELIDAYARENQQEILGIITYRRGNQNFIRAELSPLTTVEDDGNKVSHLSVEPYFVSKNETCGHEIHVEGCIRLPDIYNRIHIGNFLRPETALVEASKYYPNVDGCPHYCHKLYR